MSPCIMLTPCTRPQVCSLDAYYTDLMWYPVSSKKNQAGGTDVFAVACTDGEASESLNSRSKAWRQRYSVRLKRKGALDLLLVASFRLVQDHQPERAP